jgi:hypothetical protein
MRLGDQHGEHNDNSASGYHDRSHDDNHDNFNDINVNDDNDDDHHHHPRLRC